MLTCFAAQDLAETLPLALLGRLFMPAKVPIRPENHYRARLVFLPLFGLGEWLLMSGAAHGVATRGRTLRVNSPDWRAGHVGRVVLGACSRPGPALSYAAGNGGVRSTGESPRTCRPIRWVTAEGQTGRVTRKRRSRASRKRPICWPEAAVGLWRHRRPADRGESRAD